MMDNSEETVTTEESQKLGDELIAVLRELVQLALITGTNLVDHLRAVEVEVDEETGKLVPTEAYIIGYNEMIEDLAKKADAAQEEADAAVASLAVEEDTDNEVLN